MNFRLNICLALALAVLGTSCSKPGSDVTTSAESPSADSNPFFSESSLYFKYPEFDRIRTEHYLPAFEKGMADELAEIEAIVNQDESANFDNTLVALEKSGQLLDRVETVFEAMILADTSDILDKINSDMAPRLSAHSDKILLNDKLFQRVQFLYDLRDSMELDPEPYRLIGEYYSDFVRAGARLSAENKEVLKAMNAELASLETSFSQNVLNEVNNSAIVVDTVEELAGMSEDAIAAAAVAASERELEDKYVIPLLNTSGQPVMSSLEDRALRERIHKASLARGSSGGAYDNREVVTRVAKIRAQRAELLGYENHAAYELERRTARTTDTVNEHLSGLAPAAVANAEREAVDLQAMIDAEGGNFRLASWDWNFYTEKVRKERYDFDESQLKPYLELDSVLINGVFYAATQVFGISFKERTDLPVYHDDVRVWEIFDTDGSTLGLFIGDFYARSSKRGGAWMNAYVNQSNLMGTQPVIANHSNITKPPDGEATLLTWDDVNTMFHEFGHALHGMFSNVNYPYFAGTAVPRDFVEFPSQVNEMWSVWPDILENYAVHYETGEAMPAELLDKVLATQKFNQGFATTEKIAASILDQAWHQLKPEEVPDAEGLLEFEAKTLADAGVAMTAIPPRYRSTYFSHIMGGYSAGYYSYMWSEVLDADTVEWFKENGGMRRENGDHFRRTLLSRGGAEDAMVIFREFRGAEPNIQPLLERRGLN